MNRLLSWLIVLGLALGISACAKKDGVPLPRTGAGEIKQQAKEAGLCRWFDNCQNVLDIPSTAIEQSPFPA